VVKCHILGVAVLHDLLKHFERSQGRPLAPEARRQVEQLFNSAANFVLSTFLTPPPPSPLHCTLPFHSPPGDRRSNQAYYRSEHALRYSSCSPTCARTTRPVPLA
jgi:hypothetical protein